MYRQSPDGAHQGRCRDRQLNRRGSLIGRRLVAEPLQDGPRSSSPATGSQVRLKARRPHACAPRASRDHGDGWHRSSESDMELLKLERNSPPPFRPT